MNYTYFFHSDSPFSQWHPSRFIGDRVGTAAIWFENAEQYMMWRKAIVFGDTDVAWKILATTNPKEIKALGREVKNFDDKIWGNVRFDVVFMGNLYKFTQNPELKEALLNTKGILVEASPYDKIWGIGLSEADARKTSPESWPGKNLLGVALTRLRKILANSA